MNEVLKITLSLSCSGALLIIALCLLRPLFRTRLSKQWQYYIWLAVIARLLLPFAPETNLMKTLFQHQNAVFAPARLDDAPGMVQDSFSIAQPDAQSERNDLQTRRPGAFPWRYLWACWLMTALILFIRKITLYQSFVTYIRAGCTEAADFDQLERFGRLVAQSKVKVKVELYTNSLVSSPLLIGFFRPCIVLPTDNLSDTAFQYTILHELTHYKRRDMFFKWLVQLTICIHWFNPLVRLMGREVERSCELSCDEAVIKGLDKNMRRAYGNTLLNALENSGVYKSTIASVTLCESREQLKERLDAIADFQPKSKCATFITAVLTVSVCLVASAAGAYAAPVSAYHAVSTEKPPAIGDLTLIKKEYTPDELKTLAVSKLSIEMHSDHVSVVRGGDTLKFEYYALNPDEYVFQAVKDNSGHSLPLRVYRSPSDAGYARSMTVTVPEQLQLDALQIATTSGNINLAGCTAGAIVINTQNGQIDMRGGSVSGNLWVSSQTGDVLISQTALPGLLQDTPYDAMFETLSGTIIVQPPDRIENYSLAVDYGNEAEIFINGEGFELIDMQDSGAVKSTLEPDGTVAGVETKDTKKLIFTLNEGAPKRIRFQSPKGAFIVQEK